MAQGTLMKGEWKLFKSHTNRMYSVSLSRNGISKLESMAISIDILIWKGKFSWGLTHR